MGDTISLQVHLFGMLRGRVPGDVLEITLPAGATAGDLRRHVAGKLRLPLDACAVGDDEAILAEGSRLRPDQRLALLPPVCGG